MSNNLIKVSNLLTTMGWLAHAINSHTTASIEHQTKRVDECIADIMQDIPTTRVSIPVAQEVFIDPEDVHAFIKLTSTVSQFINAQYHNDLHLTLASVATIKYYINKIREYHNIK